MKKRLEIRKRLLFTGLMLLPGLVGCFFIFLFSLGAAERSPQAAPRPVIIIVVGESMEQPAYDSAVQGFGEALKGEKIAFQLKIYNQNETGIIGKIRAQQPALILTATSFSTKLIAEKITGIPIVFTMILDPRGAGIASKNIVGASLDIPGAIQLEILKTVVPIVKRVGVIYDPAENERLIAEAGRTAGSLGLVLKTFPVNSPGEIPGIGDLEIDALWIIPDNVVCQVAIIKRILLSSIRKGIPVMGFSRSYARAGALLALACDYKDIGRQSGELAVRILRGEDYSRLKISEPGKIKLYVNRLVADRLGITLPKEVLEEAEEVFGE